MPPTPMIVPLSPAAVSLVSHFPWLVGCPLLVWGISDGVFPVSPPSLPACLSPCCMLVVWDGAGHGVRATSWRVSGVLTGLVRHLSTDQRNGNVGKHFTSSGRRRLDFCAMFHLFL